ncbi:hypothetical protein Avbf_12955 [Armadillidium vulgare]|nr:hypothetical protein Avbf_12955 [Armadillidium vulgare]
MRNMIKYCDDESAVSEILEKVDLEDIVKLTVWDDNDISELAKLLYFYLSYDEDEDENDVNSNDDDDDDDDGDGDDDKKSKGRRKRKKRFKDIKRRKR